MYQQQEPGFFKYIVPLALTHRLRLPPAHQWNKQRNFPDEVILRDQNGHGWLVKVEKVENQVCFVDGWLKFVEENNVKEGDFVVFENVSSNVYSFLLLDSETACETGGFMGSNLVRKEEEEEDIYESEEQSLGVFEVTEESESEEDDDDDDELEEEDSEEEEDDEEDDDYDLEEEEEEEDFVRRRNISSRRIQTPESVSWRRRKSPQSQGSSFNYRKYDIYANDLFNLGVIPRPKNPYFVTRRRANRTEELYVPKNVIKDYNLRPPVKTIMRDIEGSQWETELNQWSDGRFWYHGGWGSFCRKNNVKEKDDCVCEFVKEAGKGLILFVYKLDI